MEVCGADVVAVGYLDAISEGGEKDVSRRAEIQVASNALLLLLSEDRTQTVTFLLLDGRSTLHVRDPDRGAATL